MHLALPRPTSLLRPSLCPDIGDPEPRFWRRSSLPLWVPPSTWPLRCDHDHRPAGIVSALVRRLCSGYHDRTRVPSLCLGIATGRRYCMSLPWSDRKPASPNACGVAKLLAATTLAARQAGRVYKRRRIRPPRVDIIITQ